MLPSKAAPLMGVNGSSLTAGGDPDVITILHYNDWHQRMEPMKDYAHALCDRTQADKGEGCGLEGWVVAGVGWPWGKSCSSCAAAIAPCAARQ
jgi:hypothetical protein